MQLDSFNFAWHFQWKQTQIQKVFSLNNLEETKIDLKNFRQVEKWLLIGEDLEVKIMRRD